MQREWKSQISLSGDHLRFWDRAMHGDDVISTTLVELASDDVMAASGLMYSTGITTHTDEANKSRSALLIVHNDGFVVMQQGLSQELEQQLPGKILILHPHEPHSLDKVNPSAQKWAAIFFDYEEDLSSVEVEEVLQTTYLRCFHR